MRTRRISVAVAGATLALALIAAACSKSSDNGGTSGGSFDGAAMTGAGATFPDPVYEAWFKEFQQVESGAKINYQAIGSGGGIEQLQQKTVDFGASDAPLQTADVQGFNGEKIIQFPTVVGGVAVAYNLPGVTKLNLDGPTTADIFLGKVTTWNDPEIANLNSGVQLPSTKITVAHRSDESGTTFVFTSWLSQESPEWDSRVGADKAVEWPVGNGGEGSDGVAAVISQTEGGIGYVEYQYAVTTKLGIAQIKGKNSADYTTPSVDSISAAAGNLGIPIQPTTNVLNSDAQGAYPLTSTTYLLIPQDLTSLGQDKAQTLVDFLYWALTTGQNKVQSLNYAPLPASVVADDLAQLDLLKYSGKGLSPSSTVKGAGGGSTS
jgi:phosphate transport system substrate-binding protein